MKNKINVKMTLQEIKETLKKRFIRESGVDRSLKNITSRNQEKNCKNFEESLKQANQLYKWEFMSKDILIDMLIFKAPEGIKPSIVHYKYHTNSWEEFFMTIEETKAWLYTETIEEKNDKEKDMVASNKNFKRVARAEFFKQKCESRSTEKKKAIKCGEFPYR